MASIISSVQFASVLLIDRAATNPHQFRFVREVVRQKFNPTEAARALYTSQPGVSKAIIELEEELGADIFTRYGRRIRGLTEPGRRILTPVECVLEGAGAFKRMGKDYVTQDQGNFTIAAMYAQTRYALPKAIAEFTRRYPKVRLSIQQDTSAQIVGMVLHNQVDLVITTEGMSHVKNLISIPGYQWQHVAVAPSDRPFLSHQRLTLDDLKGYPIIMYGHHFAGRPKIDHAFEPRQIKPDIALEVIDADVIKTYVGVGLGVDIVAGVAFDVERDRNPRVTPAGHPFSTSVAHLGAKQGTYLRGFVYTFIELFTPTPTRKLVEQLISGDHEVYEL